MKNITLSGDVAIAINAANLKAQNDAREALSDDAPAPVDEPLNNNGPSGSDSGQLTEEKAKARFEKSQDLQDEFLEFENYWAYIKNDPQFKIRSKKE